MLYDEQERSYRRLKLLIKTRIKNKKKNLFSFQIDHQDQLTIILARRKILPVKLSLDKKLADRQQARRGLKGFRRHKPHQHEHSCAKNIRNYFLSGALEYY